MLKYAVKRILLAILTVFIIAAITFFAMNAIPGGPFDSEKATDPTTKATLEKRFNLDKPVGEQFVLYVRNALQGDFGISLKTGRDITTTIVESFGISARLGGTSVLLAIFFGLGFGCIAALRRNKAADRAIIFFTTLFVAVPSFILATLFLLIFSLKLGWFSVWSAGGASYVLPVLSLMLYPMSYITRLTKSSMLEVLGQDYIRTARAKGVKESKVIVKHALRNALIPVITYVGPMTAYTLTGSMVVETVFTIGGLGAKFVTGINNRDYPVIQGGVLIIALFISVVILLTDIVYALVDPRIKSQFKKS